MLKINIDGGELMGMSYGRFVALNAGVMRLA
jgi:hypothetical protein